MSVSACVVGTAVVGVALAGGASSRMGRDKAALRPAPSEPTLLERTVRRLGAVCGEVVVADRGRGLLAGVASVADGPGAGPVAGILGAAAARPNRDLLVVACDLPRVPVELLRAIVASAGGDWVVPAWTPAADDRERLEPLCALYRPPALAALAGQVERGVHAVHRLARASGLAVRRLGPSELAAFGPPARTFFNVNTPAELAILRGAEPAG